MKLRTDFGVRALFGAIILAVALPTIAFMAGRGSEMALTALITLAAAISSFYFGASSQHPPITPPK